MKVEIELDELTALKNQIEQLKQNLEHANKKYRALDEVKLRDDSYNLGVDIATTYTALILNKIGFKNTSPGNIELHSVSRKYRKLVETGTYRFNPKEFDIEISADISEAYKDAYLKIIPILN